MNLDIDIRVVPTVRDLDGLALSSRNVHLSTEERLSAVAIPRALDAGLTALRNHQDPVAAARAVLSGHPGVDIDYVDIANFEGQPTLVIAARVGATRLIDNVPLDLEGSGSPGKQSGSGKSFPMSIGPADIGALKQRGQRIAVVTAYDAPSARLADAAGVDIILVGDSAAMTVFGYDSTTPVTVDDMLLLSRAVRRGTTRALVVADMPFGSVPGVGRGDGGARDPFREGSRAWTPSKSKAPEPRLHRVSALIDAGITGDGPYRVDAAIGEPARRLQSAGTHGDQGPSASRRCAGARARGVFCDRPRGDAGAGGGGDHSGR